MRCFATVGTTQFEGLVSTLLTKEVLESLELIGCKELLIQCGSGRIPEDFQKSTNDEEYWFNNSRNISIKLLRYKKDLKSEMQFADIIIGHAGAGTCLEVLELRKPFIVVINTELADNHQIELAEKLGNDGYLLFTKPSGLAETLRRPELFSLKRFEPADQKLFATFLDAYLNAY